jgi:predicted DNA-binding transcriptional regulator
LDRADDDERMAENQNQHTNTEENPSKDTALSGTTRRVYRHIYKHGPVRLHKIQRDLNLSSSSVADYHVQKLLQMGLIREEGEDGAVGYVAEKAVFEAMVRIRRTVIPLWTTATSFFAASILVLLTILHPAAITPTYVFSLLVAAVALSISAYEAVRSLARNAI